MSEDNQKQTIVIVDDNHVSLMSGKVILKDHYQVFTVPSGEKLFELLENVKPDLILLDVVMPGMNGYQVIKKLKEEENTKDIPVIFLSSLGEAENELEGFNLGALDYILKPFSAPLLLKRIETHLLTVSQAKELRHAIDHAESANSAKGSFLAHMSHEIRTPLNAIIGMSGLMRTDNLDEVQKGYLRDIQDMSKSLLHIINDILDMSKIEAGKMEVVPVHFRLGETYNHLCSAYRCLAMNKDLEFRCSMAADIPDVIFADETRVRQLITNLLGNSVKYTREGFVSLDVKKTVREGKDWLAIAISDSGIGIKKEDFKHIFSSFQQLDKEKNRHIQGTGLGLAITLNFAKLMGGTIEFDSEYGKGSVFTIYLPLVPGDPEKVEGATSMEQALAADDVAVLVVDDYPINLTVALGFLQTHNIRAETATSGMEALSKIAEKDKAGLEYHIVFMDHMMPEMDGLETTAKIREWEAKRAQQEDNSVSSTEGGTQRNLRKQVPIVALSANAMMGMDKIFLDAGMNDSISKPINANELNKVLLKWLPKDKVHTGTMEVHSDKSQGEDNWQELVMHEISMIDGIDVQAGLTNSGNNKQTYFLTLRQFTEGCENYLDEIKASLEAADWKNYSIKTHALKGVFAAFGVDKLSKWAANLEKASKNPESADFQPTLCKMETVPFCVAVGDFRDKLMMTKLFNASCKLERKNKPKGDKDFLMKQIECLNEASNECNVDESEKIVTELKKYSWDKEIDEQLEKIRQFASSYDFEKIPEVIDLVRKLASKA